MTYIMEKLDKMRIPTFNGRPMKKVQEYEHFILFIDEKTGIRQCFSIWDLTHKEYIGRLYSLPDENGNTGHNKVRGARPYANKTKNKNDNRLSDLIEKMEGATI